MIKLNIDNIPQLATALGIKSVPTVFLVHKGNIMDTFSGVPGAARLKDFVDTAVLLESMGHDEVVIQTLLDRAQEFPILNLAQIKTHINLLIAMCLHR